MSELANSLDCCASLAYTHGEAVPNHSLIHSITHSLINLVRDFSGDAPAADFISQGDKLLEVAVFDRTFALVVNQDRTLFGLFGGVLAHVNQGVDHKFKRVHFVVEDHQAAHLDVHYVFHHIYFRLKKGHHNWSALGLFPEQIYAILAKKPLFYNRPTRPKVALPA